MRVNPGRVIAKIREFFASIKNPFDLRDAHIYGGLLILAAGLWQLAPWLALCTAGFFLFLIGIFAGKLK